MKKITLYASILVVSGLLFAGWAETATASEDKLLPKFGAQPLKQGVSLVNIGTTVAVIKDVRATINSKVRKINLRSKVYQNELIETGDAAATQVVLLDETVLSMGPDSSLILDEMVFDPKNPEQGTVSLKIGQGLVRIASGYMPSENYSIETPFATIGIRGTEFDVLVDKGGATSVVLHRGAVTVTNRTGGVQRLDIAGTFTTVSGAAVSPTPAAPAPPALINMGQAFTKPGKGKALNANWKTARLKMPNDNKMNKGSAKSKNIKSVTKMVKSIGKTKVNAKDVSQVSKANSGNAGGKGKKKKKK